MCLNTKVSKSEDDRVAELRARGQNFGVAAGDGNCLISSLLQGLISSSLLPRMVLSEGSQFQSAVQSCRTALVEHPAGHPLKPAARDMQTNEIRRDATKAQHDMAYLQFDVHAAWIVKFFLQREGVELPGRGFRCICFSRFDDVLGGAETLTIQGDAAVPSQEEPLVIAVYNWTGDRLPGVSVS